MVQASSWGTKMLDKLYKKLHIVFICGIMLIISIIIVIVLNNNINTVQGNEIMLFQRQSTLIIYQLENSVEDFEKVAKQYENFYSIICVLKDDEGEILYGNPSFFPTSTEFLINAMNQQKMVIDDPQLEKENVTVQNGTFKILGQNNDIYWGIPATVVSKDDTLYNLTLLYRSKTVSEVISKQAVLYISVWLTSLICVVFLSRLILKRAFKPTEQVLKSQKDFVASASHELKSPLALIVANTEKIGKLNIENSELERSVKIVDTECMRMSQLISDMLLLASSDAKTWSVSKKEINIDTLLITLYETYEPICTKQNITLELNIADTSYPILYSDPERITQILNIFMDNAISHSGDNPSIQIKTSLTVKAITFYIVDHGNGIAEQDKPYIFDRFYCADKSHTNKSHFGLGLSIASELAKMLNGKIGFEDTANGGATFFIILPLR